MENVVPFPALIGRLARKSGTTEARFKAALDDYAEGRDARVKALMAFAIPTLRSMWDNVGDNSFCGDADCADIHAALTLKGDGDYCAV